MHHQHLNPIFFSYHFNLNDYIFKVTPFPPSRTALYPIQNPGSEIGISPISDFIRNLFMHDAGRDNRNLEPLSLARQRLYTFF